jgi:hypothetical protein
VIDASVSVRGAVRDHRHRRRVSWSYILELADTSVRHRSTRLSVIRAVGRTYDVLTRLPLVGDTIHLQVVARK